MELTPDMIEPVYTHIGTRPAANVEAEPVAWLYEYGGGTVACTVTRYEPAVLNVLGYTETPLYPADRIEALEAEVERLRGALGNLINAYTANVDTYRLDDGFYTDPETEDEVIEARAALGEKQ